MTVRGEIEDIEQLTEIRTTAIDETLIGNSQTLQLDYDLPEGVTLVGTRTKCSMKLSIKDYRERQITFIARKVMVEGLEEGKTAEIQKSLFVTVCGPYEVVSQLSASDLKAVVSVDGLTVGSYHDYPVEVAFGSDEMRNAFIKNAGGYATDLEIREDTETTDE